jgi:hypothetical protein
VRHWQPYEARYHALRAPLERMARAHPEYGYRRTTTGSPLDQPPHRLQAMRDLPQPPHLATRLRHCYRDCLRMDIQSKVRYCTLGMTDFLCMSSRAFRKRSKRVICALPTEPVVPL